MRHAPAAPRFHVPLLAGIAAVLTLMAGTAHADATLDKIRQRGKVSIGVLVNGGPFGSIDPASQQLVGWNPDLARALAKGLGVEADLVQVQTRRACSSCRPARSIC